MGLLPTSPRDRDDGRPQDGTLAAGEMRTGIVESAALTRLNWVVRDGVDPSTSGFSDRRSTD